jgi:hypothetical protein
MRLKGFATIFIAVSPLGVGFIYGLTEIAHNEASDNCYKIAVQFPKDLDVLEAMKDKFLSDHECRVDVIPAIRRAHREQNVNAFMNAAYEADHADGH